MRTKRKTTESFIQESLDKHKGFYSYENVLYTGCFELVNITCPTHGGFMQKPASHLFGNGCKQCGQEKTIKNTLSNTEKFIVKAKNRHNDFYQYDKVNYIHAKEFVTITCPVHGDFDQRPNYHLSGNGCTVCYKENNGFGKTKFIHSCRNRNLGSLYVIRCYSNSEEFVKIGITSQTIVERFKRQDRFPYNYEILYQKDDIPEQIFNLEKHYHRTFREFKYQPNILFKGSTECFSSNIKDYDFRGDEESV